MFLMIGKNSGLCCGINMNLGAFPGDPVVKNLPCNARDSGLISGHRTKVYILLFSCWVMPDSLWQHAPQHARLLCPPVSLNVHWVSDASEPSHPLLSPSPPALNLSQHQGLLQWVGSSHQVVKVLELQHPMNIQGWYPLGWTGLISLQSKGLKSLLQHNWKASTLQRSSFFTVQLSHLYMTTGKTIALTI